MFSCLNYIYALATIVLLAQDAMAAPVCPVCTIAIASGLGLSRVFGVSDTVIGVWVGAILWVMIQYTNNWLDRKQWQFPGLHLLVILLYFALLTPLYLGSAPSIIFNESRLLGIDAFLLSTVVGAMGFYVSGRCYVWMKEKNGKPHFPFERVVLPVTTVLVLSFLFYLLTK